MDRAELRDRARQEFAKRQDTILAKLGFDFSKNSCAASPSPTGNFFFTNASIELILTLIRQRLPGQAERIVQQAEQICRHRFDLLGYNDIDCGSPIDWHLDAVHQIRAPRKAFYRVEYLNFAEVGDSKVTWELNRHQHFVTLAKAFRLTDERRFADEIALQWRHWIAENPYPVGINWASSLEVALRSLSWIWTCHLLAGAPEFSNLRSQWLDGLAVHGRHIERYLSTYFSANTHLLGEGVALFFLGVMCPELAAAERWKSLGWSIVLREAEQQVGADGLHFEQSTYYHVYALDFFLHAAVLASLNDVAIPPRFEETLAKMLDALMLMCRPGQPPAFGDDDGGRVFDPQRNRREHLMDPLSTGAILFQRGDFKRAAGDLREETLWLLGAGGAREWDEIDAVPMPQESATLKDSGIYLLTGRASTTQLVINARGPQQVGSTGHAHADALSVTLQSHGNSLLIDPGTYAYAGSGGERNLFRGTAMHNTVRVDGLDQATPKGLFSWDGVAQSTVERWIRSESVDYLVVSHRGYQRLTEPVTHRRFVISSRNGTYLIRDVVEGQGNHRLEIPWHLGPELQLVEHGLYRVKKASHGLALLSPGGHAWAEEVRKESWSPVYGQKAPMTELRFSTEAALPAEFAVLLVTLEEAHGLPGSFTKNGTSANLHQYRYAGEQEEVRWIFSAGGEAWAVENVSSDAEFVCLRQSFEERHLILCGGSFAAADGIEIRCREQVAWAEVILKGTQRTVNCSNPAAILEYAAVAQSTVNATPAPES